MSLLRRGGTNKGDKGGREREPGLSGPEPAGRKAPDFGVPKVEDPYAGIVEWYIRDKGELPQVKLDLEMKFKDPTVVDLLMGRVTTGRAERVKKDQH